MEPYINTVIFPQKGNPPLTCMISGSDLDGDLFFISWDPRLLIVENYKPMNYSVDSSKSKKFGEIT